MLEGEGWWHIVVSYEGNQLINPYFVNKHAHILLTKLGHKKDLFNNLYIILIKI